jgi:hypothetical protein
MLGLYIPKVQQLQEAVVMLALAWLVLSGCAIYFRLGKIVPVAAMLLGCLLFLAPDVARLSETDLGAEGDRYRRRDNSDLADGYYASAEYFCVGPGKPIGMAGMVVALSIYAVVKKLRESELPIAADSSNSSHPDLRIVSEKMPRTGTSFHSARG